MKYSSKNNVSVLYEDSFIIAINKPSRIASVPGEGIALEKSILGEVQKKFAHTGTSPYLLHRLDMQTSGVLLFGKNSRDREKLESIFLQPDTIKKYVTLVKGVPSGKTITLKLAARNSPDKIPARTDYKILHIFKGRVPLCALLEATIYTGRKHQIRKHFAGIRHPVILDDVYGDHSFNRKFRITYRLGRIFLHAASFTFLHPFLNKKITIGAPLPPDLQSTLKKLNSMR